MTNPAVIAAALGHVPTPAEYSVPTGPVVPPHLFGKDHWGTLAYIETRTVDHGGLLDHERMRCDPARHPMMLAARPVRPRSTNDTVYPTMLKASETPGPDGHYDVERLPGHDDYDCADDLMAAGLLTCVMPTVNDDGVYVDRRGRPILIAGEPVHRDFLTGMNELALAAHARWRLTTRGRWVAAKLRSHLADGLRSHDFVMPSTRTAAATAATIRRGLNSKAAMLRENGWLVVPPEALAVLEPGLRKDLDQLASGSLHCSP